MKGDELPKVVVDRRDAIGSRGELLETSEGGGRERERCDLVLKRGKPWRFALPYRSRLGLMWDDPRRLVEHDDVIDRLSRRLTVSLS